MMDEIAGSISNNKKTVPLFIVLWLELVTFAAFTKRKGVVIDFNTVAQPAAIKDLTTKACVSGTSDTKQVKNLHMSLKIIVKTKLTPEKSLTCISCMP